MTPHQSNAAAYDIVTCSYDFVENSYRAVRDLPDQLHHYLAHYDNPAITHPLRSVSALHAAMWREMDQPIKRLILDEVQVANKRHGSRHIAIKNLYVAGTIVLSGTLTHNRWEDLSDVVAFISGHPITDDQTFKQVFGFRQGNKISIDVKGMHLLRRFMQSFTIVRPSTVLSLRSCRRRTFKFNLSVEHAAADAVFMAKYKKAARSTSSMQTLQLAYAVKAALISIHPLLLEAEEAEPTAYDADALYANEETQISDEGRAKWIERIRQSEDLCEQSERLKALLRLFWTLRSREKGRKIIIFSKFLKFLDIIEEAFSRTFAIPCLRYDGTVPPSQRRGIEVRFAAVHNDMPLLITAGACGVGLNITAASIVIQTEIWWNGNTELQALCRVFRQGQTEDVDPFRIEGSNSAVDIMMRTVQMGKTGINEGLMRNPIRRHDEEPLIEEGLRAEPIPSS